MYYHLPAGTTTEDDMFAQRTPWGGGAIAPAAATPTPTTSAAPSTASAASPVSGVPSAPTASDAPCAQTACDDRQPPGGWTCKQQARSTRGVGLGAPLLSCAAASCTHTGSSHMPSVPLPPLIALPQKDWGKCGEPWMAGFCLQTCNKCPCGAASPPVSAAPATAPSATPSPSPSPAAPAAAACTCTDVMPSRHSCADEAKWGSCGKRYMKPTTDVPEGGCRGRELGGGRGASMTCSQAALSASFLAPPAQPPPSCSPSPLPQASARSAAGAAPVPKCSSASAPTCSQATARRVRSTAHGARAGRSGCGWLSAAALGGTARRRAHAARAEPADQTNLRTSVTCFRICQHRTRNFPALLRPPCCSAPA